jgi:hypothetical protein
MGFWGVIINGIQAAALEHKGMKTAPWDAHIIGYLIIYTVSMFILYSGLTSDSSEFLLIFFSGGPTPLQVGIIRVL